jgi:hypothetical protein
MLLTLLALTSFWPSNASAQYRNWKGFRTVFEPAARGVDVTVMIPPGFGAEESSPVALKQFVKYFPTEERLAYVAIGVIPTDNVPYENRWSRIMKDRHGNWLKDKVEQSLNNFARENIGYVGSRIHYFRSYPAVDIDIRMNPVDDLYWGWADLDVRFLFFDDDVIKLECGDISAAPGSYHAGTSREICRPFFDSLTFGK